MFELFQLRHIIQKIERERERERERELLFTHYLSVGTSINSMFVNGQKQTSAKHSYKQLFSFVYIAV